MDETYKTKKVGGDKIALLGLFVVAVLTAYLITASRSVIVLSEPIELSYAGLSVSMPSGNGWKSQKQWKYEENAFTLSSVFIPTPGKPTAFAHCRYLLAASNTSPEMRIKQKASEVDGATVEIDQTQTDMLAIDWVYIKKPETLLNMFFGTAKLPKDRQLDIIVYDAAGDADLAEQAFKRITESLNFKDSQLLEAGSEIIAKIKSKGLDSFLTNQNQQAFFLIKDIRNNITGFTMDVLIDSGQDAQLNIQAAGLLYVRGHYAHEQVTSFQSDNSFDEFAWKSENLSVTSRTGTEIILDEAGIMTVRKFNAQPKEDNYRPSSVAIPEPLLEQLFSQMLDSDSKEIVVDIIKADGTTTPTFVFSVEAEDTTANEEPGHVIKLEFLDGSGFSEQVYLDNEKQILKKLLRQKTVSILERSSSENVEKQFPERADYILRKSKLLKQN